MKRNKMKMNLKNFNKISIKFQLTKKTYLKKIRTKKIKFIIFNIK